MALDPASSLTPGSVVGDWTLVRKLGEGAMGVVFEARSRAGMIVALKIVRPELLAKPDHAARFKREGKLLQRIDHRNVVKLHDVGEASGFPFLALGFIEGEALSERLRHGTLTGPEGLRLAADLLRGLGAIHQAGIVHRDLKPGNVMFARDGAWKITDFGLARRENEESIVVTRPGQVVGTPYYMSPEQCQGEPLDARSDLYSAGATLYHALTGVPLFQGKAVMDVIRAHVTDPAPDVAARAPGCPPELSKLVARLLAKQRTARPENARAALALLGVAEMPDESALILEAASAPSAPQTGASTSTPSLAETHAPTLLDTRAPTIGMSSLAAPPPRPATPPLASPRPATRPLGTPRPATPPAALPRPATPAATPSAGLPRPVTPSAALPRPATTPSTALPRPAAAPAAPAASPAEVRASSTKRFARPQGAPAPYVEAPLSAAGQRAVLTPSGRVPGIIKSEVRRRGSRVPWERATLPLLPAAIGLVLFGLSRVAGREAAFDEYIDLRNVRVAGFIGAAVGVVRIFTGFYEVNAPPSAKAKSFYTRLVARLRVRLLRRSPKLCANALRDLGEYSEAASVLLAGGFLREAGQEYLRANEVAKAAKVFEKLNDADQAVKAYNKLGDTRAATVALLSARYVEAAKLFTKHGEHAQAADAWQKAGDPIEAARSFEAASRPEDGGNELLRALENREGPFSRLTSDERHKHAVRAGDLLVRAGAALGAAARFEKLGEIEVAQQLYEEGGDFAEAGRIASSRGDHEKAADLYSKGGRHLAAAKSRGEAYMAGKKSGTGAVQPPGAGEAPADKAALTAAAGHFEAAGESNRAADLFARAGDLENAARLYEKAGFAREAALCHRERGDMASAARVLAPADPIAAAEAWAAAGAHSQALQILGQVSAASPRRGHAVALLGDLHLAAGQESEAIAAFAAAIEGTSRSNSDMQQIGHCIDALANLGRLDQAIDQLTRMRRRVGDSPEVDRMLSELSTKKKTSIGGTDLVGCIVDRYRASELLGEGGTAWVYKAEHTFLGRHVALKVLKPHPTGGTELAARFYAEAQATAGLRHPNVIHIYDVGATPGGLLYMALELIKGDGLRKRLEKRSKLPAHEAARIISGVLAGLTAAHQKGIVHRDLKPENILLADEVPKVVDFGIAKVVQTKALTMTGTFLGTPKYASPEQANGLEATAASDIYAAGLVLYELLSGRSPFESETHLGFLTKHATATPRPLREVVKDVPEPLNAAVMRALEKDPSQRWPDADAFRRAIVPHAFAAAAGGGAFTSRGETVSVPLPPDHLRNAHTSVDFGTAEHPRVARDEKPPEAPS